MLALDGKLKGQLGMQTNGGVWHRIALYDTKRRRGPSKPGRKPAAKASEVVQPGKTETLRNFVADGFTAKRGKHIAKVFKGVTRRQACILGEEWRVRHDVELDRYGVRLAVEK